MVLALLLYAGVLNLLFSNRTFLVHLLLVEFLLDYSLVLPYDIQFRVPEHRVYAALYLLLLQLVMHVLVILLTAGILMLLYPILHHKDFSLSGIHAIPLTNIV